MATSDFTISAVRDSQLSSDQLVRRLSADRSDVQQSAVKELSRLISSKPETVHTISAKTATIPLCSQLSASEVDVKLAAASALSALAKASSENQLDMAHAGVLPALASQLRADSHEVQAAALTILSTLAESQQITECLSNNGLVQQLQQYIRSPQHSVQLAALSTIDNMARSDARVRKVIGSTDILPTLVQLLTAPTPDVQHAAATALADIALTSRDQVNLNIIQCGALPALVEKLDLMQSPTDQRICHQACRTLCNLSGDNDECDEAITQAAVVDKLVFVFHHGLGKVAAVAAKTLGNLALYSVENQRTIAGSNTIEICFRHLDKVSVATGPVVEATCRLLHCLLMDDVTTYTTIVDMGGMQKLIHVLGNGNTASVRQAAAGALSHLVCTKRMPQWRKCNQVLDDYCARPKFHLELDHLHARHQTSGHSDMVTDQMTDVHLVDKSEGISAAPTESSDDGASSDNEDIANMRSSLQGMQM